MDYSLGQSQSTEDLRQCFDCLRPHIHREWVGAQVLNH